jgi:hypothetical protein
MTYSNFVGCARCALRILFNHAMYRSSDSMCVGGGLIRASLCGDSHGDAKHATKSLDKISSGNSLETTHDTA